MKLVGNKTRAYKGKDYMKFTVTIPNKCIDELGWEVGEELECEVENGKLIIEKDD